MDPSASPFTVLPADLGVEPCTPFVLILDADAKVTYADPAALHHLNGGAPLPPEGTFFDLLSPVTVRLAKEHTLSKAGQAVALELGDALQRPRSRWIRWRFLPHPHIEGGHAALALGLATAAHRHNLARIDNLHRALDALSRCTQALCQNDDETSLLDQVCAAMVEQCGYTIAWIALSDPATDALSAAAYRGVTAEQMQTMLRHCRHTAPLEAQAQEPPPASAEEGCERNAVCGRCLRLGTDACLAFPLISDQEVIGIMAVHAPEADHFDTNEASLLAEVATILGYGITVLRDRGR